MVPKHTHSIFPYTDHRFLHQRSLLAAAPRQIPVSFVSVPSRDGFERDALPDSGSPRRRIRRGNQGGVPAAGEGLPP
ncbi:hypothetical protein JHK87_003042 [Glycine soja]|nr:hypothetical protein JHK87_003042 [Glycine soja]